MFSCRDKTSHQEQISGAVPIVRQKQQGLDTRTKITDFYRPPD